MGHRSGKNKNINCDWCQICLKKLDQHDKEYAIDREETPGKHLCMDCWDKYHNIGWCKTCNEPVAYYDNKEQGNSTECPYCGEKVKRVAKDLRPVFSRERALLLFYKVINEKQFQEANIWRTPKNPNYFVDGSRVKFPSIKKIGKDIDKIRNYMIKELKSDYDQLDEYLINRFMNTVTINERYFQILEDNSSNFLRKLKYEEFSDLPLVVSFSGGKDSTVVADLVKRTLGLVEQELIFNNTTLEQPQTLKYIKKFANNNEMSLIETTNRDKYIHRGNYFYQITPKSNFHNMVEEIGPPSRGVRWCCSVFKANGINELLQAWGDKVLTIYGIRNNESVSRSYYCPVTDQGKISMQITASPIINWTDFDVWLYMLKYKVLFNDLYRYGYNRVGCWLCPMESAWSDILNNLYFPGRTRNWRDYLVSYAKDVLNKPDPEEYVDSGNWKKRFGGAGRVNSFKGIKMKVCGLRENTMHYNLKRVVETNIILEYFKPFGTIDYDKSNKTYGYYYIKAKGIVKKYTDQLMLEIKDGSDIVRVTFINPKNKKNIKLIQAYVKYQLIKYEVCIQCTACEIACPYGAITVVPGHNGEPGRYEIDEKICGEQEDCIECTWHFESNGCLIAKSLYG